MTKAEYEKWLAKEERKRSQQSSLNQNSFEELRAKVIRWAEIRGIDKGLWQPQFEKFKEEAKELFDELQLINPDPTCIRTSIHMDLELEFGDVLVTLILLANRLEIDPVDCLNLAYEKIKHRKGRVIDGQFVKEASLPAETPE